LTISGAKAGGLLEAGPVLHVAISWTFGTRKVGVSTSLEDDFPIGNGGFHGVPNRWMV